MDILKSHISTAILLFMTMISISCKRNFESQMTMTTDKINNLEIGLNGSWGTAKIDWGNGTTTNSSELWSLETSFSEKYSEKKAYTITIYGSRLNTIKGLSCCNKQLTSLDVSKNPRLKSLVIIRNKLTNIDVSKNLELTELNCTGNQLKDLDVRKNTLLENLVCENNQLKSLNVRNNPKLMSLFLRSNQLAANELNALFETLHKNKIWEFQTIYIGGNPGANSCDKSIAISKGWKVDTESVEFK